MNKTLIFTVFFVFALSNMGLTQAIVDFEPFVIESADPGENGKVFGEVVTVNPENQIVLWVRQGGLVQGKFFDVPEMNEDTIAYNFPRQNFVYPDLSEEYITWLNYENPALDEFFGRRVEDISFEDATFLVYRRIHKFDFIRLIRNNYILLSHTELGGRGQYLKHIDEIDDPSFESFKLVLPPGLKISNLVDISDRFFVYVEGGDDVVDENSPHTIHVRRIENLFNPEASDYQIPLEFWPGNPKIINNMLVFTKADRQTDDSLFFDIYLVDLDDPLLKIQNLHSLHTEFPMDSAGITDQYVWWVLGRYTDTGFGDGTIYAWPTNQLHNPDAIIEITPGGVLWYLNVAGNLIVWPSADFIEQGGGVVIGSSIIKGIRLPEVTLPEEINFLRGDANSDGGVDLTDAIVVLRHLFTGGAAPECADAADADDNGSINLADAIFILNYIFRGGTEPPAPGPVFPGGVDPTPDNIGCEIGL